MANRENHAVAELFPLLEGAALDELAADIKKNGLLEPILVDAEGRIVDGRNRYRACLAAGVEPRFVEWQGRGELADLVLSVNLRRRHLTESQRAMVAARLAKLLEKRKGRPRENIADLRSFSRGTSSGEAAAQVNVSSRLAQYAGKVLQSGCAELIAAVESGAIAVSPASVLAGLLTSDQQKNVVAGGAKELARKVRELRGEPSPRRSPGKFGLVRLAAEEQRGPEGGEVRFLWVESAALNEAIEMLKAGGFDYAPVEV